MRRFNIFKSLATFATALALMVGCASDPDVVAAGEDDEPEAAAISGVASYVDLQTIRFTPADGAKFDPIESLSMSSQLGGCFRITVTCEEATGEKVENEEGEMEDVMETIYSADFTGSSVAVDSDGSLLIAVADPYLSSSDVLKVTYKRDTSLTDLSVDSGSVLKSFSYLEVEGSGDGSQSYEVANWIVKKDGVTTSIFPLEYVMAANTVTANTTTFTFEDLSNSGAGKDLYVASAWSDLNGAKSSETTLTVSASALDTAGSGVTSISMQSVFTRPVYYVDNEIRYYAYKITDDDDEYKGLYELDKVFEIKVYPYEVTAAFKLFSDTAMQAEIVQDVDGSYPKEYYYNKIYDSIPVYTVNVGDDFYMSDQTYPTSASETKAFDMECEWVFHLQESDTSLTTTDYESEELDSDMARAMFYKSATKDTYVIVEFTATDDRSSSEGTASDTQYFALSVVLDPSSALYTAKITGIDEVTLTLSDTTTHSFNSTVATDYYACFVARRTSITEAADKSGYIAKASYTSTTSSESTTTLELRSNKVEVNGTNQLVITFPMNLYTGENFSLIYDGHDVNYLGEVQSTYMPFELSDSSISLLSDVPIALGDANLSDTLSIPEFNYSFRYKDTTTTLDVANRVYEPATGTMVIPSSATTTLARFAAYKVGESADGWGAGFSNVKWQLNSEGYQEDSDSGEGVDFTLSEGQSTVDLSFESTRPCNYPTTYGYDSPATSTYGTNAACYFTNVLDLGNNKFTVSKSITMNVYKQNFNSFTNDVSVTLSSDAFGENVSTFTTTDSSTDASKSTASVSTNAGDPLYFTLNSFGVDEYTIVDSTDDGSSSCTIQYVNPTTGAVYTNSATSNIIKVNYSKAGDFKLTLTAEREERVDDSMDNRVAEKGELSCEITATVSEAPIAATLNYDSTTTVYITLDNGSSFSASGVNTANLINAFKVYYSAPSEGDTFSAASQLTIKSVSFTTNNTRLQLTLNGGTTDRFYTDDVVYVTYDGSVAVPTTDASGRSLSAFTTVSDALTLGEGGVDGVVMTTDDSFDFDNMSYGNLSYSGYSSTTEATWTFGTSSSVYSEAAVVADPTDSSKRCIKLIADPKVSTNRVLYNGSHFKLVTSTQYKISFKMLIPHDITLAGGGQYNSSGTNVRPNIALVFGSESAYTWGSYTTPITTKYLNSTASLSYGDAANIGQWVTYSAGPSYFNITGNGTPEYNRIGINFIKYDDDAYIRDVELIKYEVRP
ncbi:MAG: hypothetical protein SNJ09_03505 [Rikenellaceae bacterium]